MPQSSRTAELYGLPKDHKPGVPLRPIVSACGDPLDNISQLIEILSQVLQFVPAHLNNTDECLRRLSDKYPSHILPAGTILFSVDVTNLYGNIPYQEAIDSAKQLLDTHHQSINMFGLNISDVTSLLEHCLSNNHLQFGDKFYRQTSGIAMGSRVAPPLAIIFMNSLERQYNSTAVNTPDLYMRYIDDVLGVWTSGPENLRDYLHHINSTHPSISFTIETTEDSGSIPFLDTKITVEPDGKYTTELYIKPTSSGIILHADSAKPWKTKRAVLYSQTRRAIRFSCDEYARGRSIQRIRELFFSNGYNDKIIDRTIANCTTRTRHDPARHDPTNRTRTRFKKPITRMILPFIDDKLTTTVETIIRGSDLLELGVTWTNGCTIKSPLVRSALKPQACPGGARCHACIAGPFG